MARLRDSRVFSRFAKPKTHKTKVNSPAPPKPTDSLCAICAKWDLVGQSSAIRPRASSTPQFAGIKVFNPLHFDAGLIRLVEEEEDGQLRDENCLELTTSRETENSRSLDELDHGLGGIGKIESKSNPIQRIPGSGLDMDRTRVRNAFHIPPMWRGALKRKRTSEATQPDSQGQSPTSKEQPVYSNRLSLVKQNKNCPLCRLLLKSMDGSKDVDSPPWDEETMIVVTRVEFASLYDDGQLEAESNRPEWGSHFRSMHEWAVKKSGHDHDLEFNQKLELAGFRFDVRLIDGKNPVYDGRRRYGIQRMASISSTWPDLDQYALLGRAIGTPQERLGQWVTWSNLCLLSHGKACHPEFIDESYAIRLIDVKKKCIVDGQPSRIYTALSYVSGNGKKLELTKETSERLHSVDGLSDSHGDIPKVISDALRLCEKMDELYPMSRPYLWIDSLCIMQDDPEDKEYHRKNMDQVYSGAWLTIVAGSGDSSDAGLAHMDEDAAAAITQDVEVIHNVPFMTTCQTFLNSMRDSSWNSRGWTLPEKHLSKRLLFFGPQQCYFHCACATWYEDAYLEFPDPGFPTLGVDMRWGEHRKNGKKHLKWSPSETDRERYKCIADAYVHRDFSYPADGEDAINPLLHSLIKKTDNHSTATWLDRSRTQFHWALPEAYLPAMLLTSWPTEDPATARSKPFPSWSWLSRHVCDPLDKIKGDHPAPEHLDPRVPFYRFNDNGEPVRINCIFHKSSGLSEFEEHFDDQDDLQAHIPTIVLVENEEIATEQNTKKAMQEETPERNELALFQDRAPPLSHLLAFREKTCQLWVDEEPVPTSSAEAAASTPAFGAFAVRYQAGGSVIGSIALERNWRTQRPPMLDFVVVAASPDYYPTQKLHLVCVEWDGAVARRIQSLSAIENDDLAKAVDASLRLILLA